MQNYVKGFCQGVVVTGLFAYAETGSSWWVAAVSLALVVILVINLAGG
jgi:hypothetical protein